LLAYFNGYAKKFNLMPLIKFGTEVLSCQQAANNSWQIRWKHIATGKESVDSFDGLVVCNGHHHEPRYPDYPGEFTGEYIHSHDYKKASPFKDKKVLVIGGGNSACDVSVETARVSKSTAISWRRGYYLIPKFMFGLTTDMYAKQSRWLPKFIRYPLMRLTLEWIQGKNEDIGLPKVENDVMATHPTVNSELYDAIRHGKVKPYGDIRNFDGKTVHFKNGLSQDFDVVIACTGFKIKHKFFEKALINFESGPVPLLHKMIPEKIRNLYFIGLFQPLGCIWPGAELQAKLAAKHFAGLWSPQKPIGELINQELNNPDVAQLSTPRHTITVDDFSFRNRLQKELNIAQ
jgi:hypothetical protein